MAVPKTTFAIGAASYRDDGTIAISRREQCIEFSYEEARELLGYLDDVVNEARFHLPGKDYDHAAAQDSMPGPGETCKHCGEDITWMGPGIYDWMHVDDKENR